MGLSRVKSSLQPERITAVERAMITRVVGVSFIRDLDSMMLEPDLETELEGPHQRVGAIVLARGQSV